MSGKQLVRKVRRPKMDEYRNPVPIKITDDKAIFKVEKMVPVPYIERILPLEYAPLYEQLAQLDIAIPKIVELEKGDQLTVIEEYIDKPRLDDYLKTQQLTSSQIHDLIIQLLDILDVLHRQKPPIIHRDIKPENLFYDGKKLILADFDIARNLSKSASRDTQVLGSVGYAAPEQFGFSQSGPASDLYAVGVLMNVLYTGKLPSVKLYQGPERKIIEKATHINAQERYQSAGDFKTALRKLSHASWRLPGFRSGQVSHMLAGAAGYLIILYSIYNMDVTGTGSIADAFLQKTASFLILILLVFFIFDYRQIKAKCLFHASPSKPLRFWGQVISYFAIATIIFCALASLSVIIESF